MKLSWDDYKEASRAAFPGRDLYRGGVFPCRSLSTASVETKRTALDLVLVARLVLFDIRERARRRQGSRCSSAPVNGASARMDCSVRTDSLRSVDVPPEGVGEARVLRLRRGGRCCLSDTVRPDRLFGACGHCSSFRSGAHRLRCRPDEGGLVAELIRSKEEAVYPPPKLERLELAAVDRGLLSAAYELVRSNAATRDRSPTYWRDVGRQIGLG